MLYREIIAVCSETHTKHINTLCGQNVGIFNVKLGDAYSIVECTVFGRWKRQRIWRTGLLGLVNLRGVGVYLLATSV